MNLIERIHSLPAITTEAHDLAERRYGKDYLQHVPACEAELIKQWRTTKQYFRIDVPTMKDGAFIEKRCACREKYVEGFTMIVYLQPSGKYDWCEIPHHALHIMDSPRVHKDDVADVRRNVGQILRNYNG